VTLLQIFTLSNPAEQQLYHRHNCSWVLGLKVTHADADNSSGQRPMHLSLLPAKSLYHSGDRETA
jgi:hypothetical protein